MADSRWLRAAAFSVTGRDGECALFRPLAAAAVRADLKRPWAAISKAAGLTDVRIHDLRHSFASMGAGASLGLPIIGKLLGHTGCDHSALQPSGRRSVAAGS